MNKISNQSVIFTQNIDQAIAVMKSAGQWLQDSGKNPNEWWQVKNLNHEFLLKHAEPDEFYVGLIKRKPAVASILQDNERNQSWKSVDGNKSKLALYIHWLCVDRQFAGMNLPEAMMNFSHEEAKKRNLPLLRLDTETDKPILRKLYENLGFTLMGIEGHTAFYQKVV